MPGEMDRLEARRALAAAVADRSAPDVLSCVRQLKDFGKASDLVPCASAVRAIAPELQERGHRPLRVFVVRSCTVEPMLPALTVEWALSGFLAEIQVGGFGSYVVDLLAQPSSDAQQADVALVLLELADIAGTLPDLCAGGRHGDVQMELDAATARVLQLLSTYRSQNSARLVLQGMVVPTSSSLGLVGDANLKYSLVRVIRELNERLAEACRQIPDCAFFDVDQVAANFGRAGWTDKRMYLSARVAVAAPAFATYAAGLVRTVTTFFRAPRKVFCTDLDNTLWGGVLGEEGPQGIATGSAFPGNCFWEYQRYLKQLAARGVLLAVVSKNNPADVEEAFRLRAADLALGLEDFTALKIGWGEKSEAMRELAKELNVGLDSFVFMDDSAHECEAVRRSVPEIQVIHAPSDRPWSYVEILDECSNFDTRSITSDDTERGQEYKAQSQRESLKSAVGNTEDFLESLGITCTFISATDFPLERAVQLLAKTNQFNLTTRRHSTAEVQGFLDDPLGIALAVRVKDQFGDSGIVGLALAKIEGEGCTIDSLLLSCRVIGRGIQSALLSVVAARAKRLGGRWLIGEYIPSSKNQPCATFYADHGFHRTSGGDGAPEMYRLDLNTAELRPPHWLTLEGELP